MCNKLAVHFFPVVRIFLFSLCFLATLFIVFDIIQIDEALPSALEEVNRTRTPFHVSPSSCDLTLVTAYFEIQAKRSGAVYRRWMQNVLKLDACMIVHVGAIKADLPIVFAKRDPRLTRWMLTDLHASVSVLNSSRLFWEDQFNKDPEADSHGSYELYWVWLLKPIFLRNAAVANPFRSRFFFWIDAGFIRDPYFGRQAVRTVPLEIRPFDQSVVFEIVAPFSKTEGHGNIVTSNRLSSGLWGGASDGVIRFHAAFLSTFFRLADSGHFVGKDQIVINTACKEDHNSGLCIGVRAYGAVDVESSWFFILRYLIGDVVSGFTVGPV